MTRWLKIPPAARKPRFVEAPSPAACAVTPCPVHAWLKSEPGVHETISTVLGFGRSYPDEIIDDCFIELVRELRFNLGSYKAAGGFLKKTMTRAQRVQARAVLINLSRIRRENGGRLPWEA